MRAEFSGVPEKIHGVIASDSLCYQCLGKGQMDNATIQTEFHQLRSERHNQIRKERSISCLPPSHC